MKQASTDQHTAHTFILYHIYGLWLLTSRLRAIFCGPRVAQSARKSASGHVQMRSETCANTTDQRLKQRSMPILSSMCKERRLTSFRQACQQTPSNDPSHHHRARCNSWEFGHLWHNNNINELKTLGAKGMVIFANFCGFAERNNF